MLCADLIAAADGERVLGLRGLTADDKGVRDGHAARRRWNLCTCRRNLYGKRTIEGYVFIERKCLTHMRGISIGYEREVDIPVFI